MSSRMSTIHGVWRQCCHDTARRVLGAALVLSAPGLAGCSSEASTATEQAIVLAPALDAVAAAAVESGQTVGLALAVHVGGEPVLSRGYGLADLENRVPVTDSTVFRIGSITKQFTAAAILRLEEEGLLALDDDLTRFLPDYPTGGRVITVRQLLNHTSGIASYTDLDRWKELLRLDVSHEEVVALFEDEPFDFEPGEGWTYNNSAYYLLGMIIEKVTRRGYEYYLEDVFLGPLGLRDTSYCWNGVVIPRRARGYMRAGSEIRNADPLSMTHPGAAGGLCSSARDLARWEAALRTGDVVSRDSYRRMTTPAGIPEDAPVQYGYGLGFGDLEGHEWVGHGGGINGFRSLLVHYSQEEMTIVALVNLSGPAADQVAEAAGRIMLGLERDE